jgi:hypothetical protein
MRTKRSLVVNKAVTDLVAAVDAAVAMVDAASAA